MCPITLPAFRTTGPVPMLLMLLLASDPAYTSDEPTLAGGVPLSYWYSGPATNQFGWTNLPAQLVYSNLPPGSEWTLRLAVRRADMVPYAGLVGPAGALYQSLLEVADGASTSRLLLPVTAQGFGSQEVPFPM